MKGSFCDNFACRICRNCRAQIFVYIQFIVNGEDTFVRKRLCIRQRSDFLLLWNRGWRYILQRLVVSHTRAWKYKIKPRFSEFSIWWRFQFLWTWFSVRYTFFTSDFMNSCRSKTCSLNRGVTVFSSEYAYVQKVQSFTVLWKHLKK